MASVLHALHAAAEQVVKAVFSEHREAADAVEAVPAQDGVDAVPARPAIEAAPEVALWFRIRRVGPDELAPATQLALAAMSKAAVDESQGHAAARAPGANTDPQALKRMLDIQRDYLTRGVVSVSQDGTNWEQCRFVEERAAAAPDAGRLHTSSLPTGAAARLSAAIIDFSGNEEAAGRAIASFLGT